MIIMIQSVANSTLLNARVSDHPRARRLSYQQLALNSGLYLSDFHWGSEFRLATIDYSGHGGCQIGTVE